MDRLASISRWFRTTIDFVATDDPWQRGLIAGLLAVMGLVLAKLAQRGVASLTLRLAGWVGRWSRWREPAAREAQSLSKGAGRVAYWLAVGFTALAATAFVDVPFAASWLSGSVAYMPRALAAVAIVVAGGIAARLVRHLVTTAGRTASLAGAARLGLAAQVGILAAAWLLALEQLGIEISFLKSIVLVVVATSFAGVALAFGLGASRVISSILQAHFVHKLYRLGERVQVDTIEGYICQITPTFVVVQSDDRRVAVPVERLAQRGFTLLGTGPK